jgi:hypothetical protein
MEAGGVGKQVYATPPTVFEKILTIFKMYSCILNAVE